MLSFVSTNHPIIIYQNNYETTIEKLKNTKGVIRSHIFRRADNTMANRKGTRAQKQCSTKHSTEI